MLFTDAPDPNRPQAVQLNSPENVEAMLASLERHKSAHGIPDAVSFAAMFVRSIGDLEIPRGVMLGGDEMAEWCASQAVHDAREEAATLLTQFFGAKADELARQRLALKAADKAAGYPDVREALE